MSESPRQQAKSFWSNHLVQWQSTGLSQTAYCRQHDLCQQKFSYRKRQSHFSKQAVNSSAGFVQVQVNTLVQSSASDVGLSIRVNDDLCIEGITENNLVLIPQLLTVLR